MHRHKKEKKILFRAHFHIFLILRQKSKWAEKCNIIMFLVSMYKLNKKEIFIQHSLKEEISSDSLAWLKENPISATPFAHQNKMKSVVLSIQKKIILISFCCSSYSNFFREALWIEILINFLSISGIVLNRMQNIGMLCFYLYENWLNGWFVKTLSCQLWDTVQLEVMLQAYRNNW